MMNGWQRLRTWWRDHTHWRGAQDDRTLRRWREQMVSADTRASEIVSRHRALDTGNPFASLVFPAWDDTSVKPEQGETTEGDNGDEPNPA